MKIIVGLGNPGSQYLHTRHNVGFLALDFLVHGKRFSLDKKMESELYKEGGFLFVKPQTFMNDSGRAVRKVMDFYKIEPKDLILIHDDLDLKLGDYKIQMSTGPKVHNGVNSVEEVVGNKDFLRVRIGVDARDKQNFFLTGADYVLGRFGKEELGVVEEVIEEANEELLIALGL